MTVREAYARGTGLLEQKGIPEAALDAWYLLEHVTGISRAQYFADGGKALDEAQETRYFALVEKRGQRIPLQHLTGVQEFMGFSFLVNEHVLIPRQDTETLVEEALSVLKREAGPARVLDMCTGSGCILLSVLKLMCRECGYRTAENSGGKATGYGSGTESGERATGYGDGTESGGKATGNVSGAESGRRAEPAFSGSAGGPLIYGTGADLSGPALEVAVQNAVRLGVQADFCRSDLFENINGRFSMILSNPPYIRTAEIETLQEEVRFHDPPAALDGGADGLDFYRRIIRESRDYLLPKGYLMFETGYDQAAAVADLMKAAGFGRISVKKDLAGLDRVVSGVYD